MEAFHRCQALALADPAFRRQFRLSEEEEALVAADPGFSCPMPTSRLDAFFGPGAELRFTEYNAETPAGAAYGDVLAEAFLTSPAVREFRRRYRLSMLPGRPGVFHALTAAFEQWSGGREPPRIAILDWREVPTYSEFVLFESIFRPMAWSA